MAEYLAPGVYVEEASLRAKTIEGVPTGTAAFVGPTLAAPAAGAPALLTAFAEFERSYGGLGDLPGPRPANLLAHSVRAFFENGGTALYVSPLVLREGAEPGRAEYEAALAALEPLEDVAVVAAPGHSVHAEARAIREALVAHVERPGAHRFAVLDLPPGLDVSGVLAARAGIRSSRAALYFPWIVAANPLAGPARPLAAREVALPPSGFVCGLYARNDRERGVWKAPANGEVRGALRLEHEVTSAEQGLLNPEGVNCLRHFPGRGFRVWGARTTASDPEWKYVGVRRLATYLEASIDRGTRWAVFEPNGERLWSEVQRAIAEFLHAEWRRGALVGATPAQAFFVRCDRTTMTQADLDQGRFVCLVGVALVEPAEFVVLRIEQRAAAAAT